MNSALRTLHVLLTVAAATAPVTALQASQFTYLDAAYQQEIFTGPLVGGPAMAWTGSGNLLTLDGPNIIEYSPTQNAVHLGTNIHAAIATHTIAGLLSSAFAGYGMVNGTDGYIYATTGTGLQRIDPTTWTVTTPGANLPGIAGVGLSGSWGITVLPDGRIVYVAGSGTNEIYVYDAVAMTNTLIYTAAGLIDDIQASPSGVIALAGQGLNNILIIDAAGTLLSTVATTAFPDGLAFGYGAAANKLFSNDNMGTITEYDFNPGYTALLGSPINIASGGSYGDLATVGPDCALYVSQFFNNNYHGSASFGTRWDDTTVNNEPSIVRISSRDGSCAFSSSGGGTNPVAEPGGAPLVLGGLAILVAVRRRLPQPAAALVQVSR